MIARILHRYNEANFWASLTGEDAILKEGELGIESDTGFCKIGDGKTAWTELGYYKGEGQDFFSQKLVSIPRELSQHRGCMATAYTGPGTGKSDRICIYLQKTDNNGTICELIPLSYFANEQIKEQAVLE